MDIPADALPFLSHGLDPSLFDVSALQRLERGGRLPVQVSYRGQVPSLPGRGSPMRLAARLRVT